MKLRLVAVGKTRERIWQPAEREFTNRLSHYCSLQLVSAKDASFESLRNAELVKQAEAKEIRSKLGAGEFVVALDPGGKQMTSEALAEFLQKKMVEATRFVTFVIGGPLGLADEILELADLKLSLSKMTLPHELCKIMLLEQLYRAFTILRGEKYHK